MSEVKTGTRVLFAPEPAADPINHPDHYAAGRRFEPIDVIADWGLGFNLGCVVKYVSRAGRKGDAIEDLEKAAVYLRHEIERRKGEVKP